MSTHPDGQQDDRDATHYGSAPASADDVAARRPDAPAIPISSEDVAVTRYRAPPGGESVTDPAASPRMRQPQVHRVRCPHCHSPIQLVDERPQDVLCPGCGSSFRMREAEGTIAAPSMRLGKFQLLERIGHGAFGAVWRALDVELERIVALKIPHAGLAISAAELQHFQDEARKAAKLRHPGIITIHEVTMLQGMPVIVSDFIQGVTLKDLLEVRRPDFRETARLIADAAEALHHAHVNGLVHRDVKPANIMVERVGLQADGAEGLGRPLVLDFGLALREEALVTMTIDGEVIGTPAYINPEQAAGRGHYADGRSDVFSLGVVLYEMLCGELPFRGSRLMLFDQVLRDDPRPPRRINERIPRDLETICLKAMAKLPAQRYQTAEEFAADLRRFLADEPIHARRAGRAERLWRWCRRRPRDAALIAVVAGLLLLLAVGSTTAAFWIERERRRAEMHLGQTLESLDLLSAAAEQVTDDAPQMESEQRALLEKALKLRQTILEEEPTAVSRADLARAYHQMGRILKNLGDTNLAKEDFTRAVTEWEALAAGGDPDARHNAALNHNDLAEVLRATHPTEASDHYQEAVRIQENLTARYPDRDDYRQELARTHNNYGIFLKQNGDAGGTTAKKEYDESVNILKVLLTKDPSRPDFQADLARALINRGECQGNTPEAIGDYQKAIGLLEALRVSNPGKHDYRFRLGVANEDRGTALAGQAKLPEAEAADRAALGEFTRLADEFPKTPLYQKEKANTLNNLGLVLWRGTQPDRARQPWQTAQGIFRCLLADHPEMLEYKSNAAQNLSNLGLLALKIDHNPKAAEPLLAGAVALQETVWGQSGRKNLHFLRSLCGSRYLHAYALAKQGAYEDAAAEAEVLYSLAANEDADARIVSTLAAAGVLSQCVQGVETNVKLGKEKGRVYAARALELLRNASAGGLKYAAYEADDDFDPVRKRPEFIQLLKEWKAREHIPS